ncbi:hypothetical protein B1R32_11422 [Abditibacterium utsteinense]|uniref:DUF4190 domain-containing protein n=1 Tax=Abditibacterium utsteinense TaxID=1960156 RepID=A0A2S8SQX2_9BACT|nr:hypothetical protein [Abditibacterium utsteinense]PQV63197.1 hypothetical protein B1R32_11422 [Abditibacterium utsteinense]
MQPPISSPHNFSPPPLPNRSENPNVEADTTGGIIPYKNPQALLAYYIGLFSLLPVLGLAMAPAAVVLGIKGLKYARQHPLVKGQAHAWIGVVCGGFWSLVHWIIALAILFAWVSGNMGSSR